MNNCFKPLNFVNAYTHRHTHTRTNGHQERESSLWFCLPLPSSSVSWHSNVEIFAFPWIWQEWIESQKNYYRALYLCVEYVSNLPPFSLLMIYRHCWLERWLERWLKRMKACFPLWYEFAFLFSSFSYNITVLFCDLIMIPLVFVKLISSQF